MPQVYTNNIAKHVKDLGWLQRHLGLVKSVEVRDYSHDKYAGYTYQGCMSVTLTDNRTFWCEWMSLKLCAKWLARPSLRGVKVWWINHETTCDQLAHYHFGRD
jgi:hypothetical protein